MLFEVSFRGCMNGPPYSKRARVVLQWFISNRVESCILKGEELRVSANFASPYPVTALHSYSATSYSNWQLRYEEPTCKWRTQLQLRLFTLYTDWQKARWKNLEKISNGEGPFLSSSFIFLKKKPWWMLTAQCFRKLLKDCLSVICNGATVFVAVFQIVNEI